MRVIADAQAARHGVAANGSSRPTAAKSRCTAESFWPRT